MKSASVDVVIKDFNDEGNIRHSIKLKLMKESNEPMKEHCENGQKTHVEEMQFPEKYEHEMEIGRMTSIKCNTKWTVFTMLKKWTLNDIRVTALTLLSLKLRKEVTDKCEQPYLHHNHESVQVFRKW